MPLFKCSASKAKPKNGIRYITDQNKAAFVSAKNLFEDEDYAKQFEETAKSFVKARSSTKGNTIISNCLAHGKIT